MSLKEALHKKISAEIQQTQEYKMLLGLIKKERLGSEEALRQYVATEIKKCKECLTKCCEAGSTSNRKRGTEAHTIEFFELIQKKILSKL